jgi:hypothetical protein
MFHVPFDEGSSDCTGTRDLFKRNRVFTPSDRRRTRKLELEIRNSLIRLSRLIVALRDEMSLLPVRATHQLNSGPRSKLSRQSPLTETHDTIPQRYRFHASDVRYYGRHPQNKGAYTCERSRIRGLERSARVCTPLSTIRFDIRVSDTRGHTDLGILRVHLAVRLRTCFQGATTSATVPPFCTARAHHAHIAHRTIHARFAPGSRDVAYVCVCGGRDVGIPGRHPRQFAQHRPNAVRHRRVADRGTDIS